MTPPKNFLEPSRRQLLAASAASAAWTTGAALGVPRGTRLPAEGERVLLVLQLRGGNDGLNTLAPIRDPRYARLRPHLGLDPARALPIDDERALHPALRRLAKRYEAGQVAFVENVGPPIHSLSHFRSQDVWATASVAPLLPPEGWLAGWSRRVLGADAPATSLLALGHDLLPAELRSEGALACAVPSLERYALRTKGLDESLMTALLEGDPGPGADTGLQSFTRAARAARESVLELARTERVKSAARYPDSKLGADLALAARTVAAGLPVRVLYVTQDGYDTHAQQIPTQRGLFQGLDTALGAFFQDLSAQGCAERVLVMTVSDFGRRVAENGQQGTVGTDHGTGSMMAFLGAPVRGGVLGELPDLDDVDEAGNLNPKTDFRRAYAAALGWLGAGRFEGGASALAREVLGGSFEPLPVV